jgi:hypothetical protein
MDPRVRVFFQADQGQRFARNLATPRPAHTLETKPERDVIDYIEPWHQCVFLKYDTALGTGSNDGFTVQPRLPGGRIDETCVAVQQCVVLPHPEAPSATTNWTCVAPVHVTPGIQARLTSTSGEWRDYESPIPDQLISHRP